MTHIGRDIPSRVRVPRQRGLAAILLIIALITPRLLCAEVVEKSPTGFLVHHSVTVRGTTAAAYTAFVEHVGLWWSPSHTFTGDAANLYLEPRAGGCFCERLPNGGSARHLEVLLVAPGALIRMSGGLGPLQGHGVAGSMTWAFTQKGDSTVIDQAYSVGGYFKGGLDKIAPIADKVLDEILASLASYINTGVRKPE